MVLTRCITLRQAYLAVDWRIVILIGGTLALGTAMEKTGTANAIAENLVGWSGALGPVALIAVLYLLTLGMTEIMSNNATAALLDSHRHLHCPSGWLGSPPLCLLRGLCRLLQFPDAHRLSDQHHGVRPGRIPVYRLLQGGSLAEPYKLARGHPADPPTLAVQLDWLGSG